MEAKNTENLLGFILLDKPGFDLSPLKSRLLEDWGVELAPEQTESPMPTCSLTWDGSTFLINEMPFPVPEQDAQKAAALNLTASETEESIAKNHKAFLTLTAFHTDASEKVKTRVQFTKIACSLLALPGASALFMGGNGNILSAEKCHNEMTIIKAAEAHDDVYLPSAIWVNIQFTRQEKALLFYTTGLADLSKKEIILHTHGEPQEAFQILKQIIFFLIQNNTELEDGHLAYSEEVHLLVKTDTDSESGQTVSHMFLM